MFVFWIIILFCKITYTYFWSYWTGEHKTFVQTTYSFVSLLNKVIIDQNFVCNNNINRLCNYSVISKIHLK